MMYGGMSIASEGSGGYPQYPTLEATDKVGEWFINVG